MKSLFSETILLIMLFEEWNVNTLWFWGWESLGKVHKHRKRRSFLTNSRGPNKFEGYKDGKGHIEQNDGGRICIIKGGDDTQWERPRHDFKSTIMHTNDMIYEDKNCLGGRCYICNMKLGFKVYVIWKVPS